MRGRPSSYIKVTVSSPNKMVDWLAIRSEKPPPVCPLLVPQCLIFWKPEDVVHVDEVHVVRYTRHRVIAKVEQRDPGDELKNKTSKAPHILLSRNTALKERLWTAEVKGWRRC